MALPAALEDKPLLETKHRALLLLGVILVSVCQFLDATIAAVALPNMKAALGASSESISWVLTSFIITTAIATPLAAGQTSDYRAVRVRILVDDATRGPQEVARLTRVFTYVPQY